MLKRTIYGVEYNPRQGDDEPSVFGWIVALVAIATLVLLGISLAKRLGSSLTEGPDTVEVVVDENLAVEPKDPPPASVGKREEEEAGETNAPAAAVPAPVTNVAPVVPVVPAKIVVEAGNRPIATKNLLLRLEEATRRRDLHMEATTIEQLRAQPGAEDLDDRLARRLGAINMKRLFELKSREWVEQVVVKRGDSASRIASEHGTTFAAFAKLNGGKVDRIIAGRKLYVMSRPKFSLTIHRRLRYADLKLNDKFFKRYDLRSEPKVANGAHKWGEVLAELPINDRKELEMMLPRATVTIVSEL